MSVSKMIFDDELEWLRTHNSQTHNDQRDVSWYIIDYMEVTQDLIKYESVTKKFHIHVLGWCQTPLKFS